MEHSVTCLSHEITWRNTLWATSTFCPKPPENIWKTFFINKTYLHDIGYGLHTVYDSMCRRISQRRHEIICGSMLGLHVKYMLQSLSDLSSRFLMYQNCLNAPRKSLHPLCIFTSNYVKLCSKHRFSQFWAHWKHLMSLKILEFCRQSKSKNHLNF